MAARLLACLFACSLLVSCKSGSPEAADQPPAPPEAAPEVVGDPPPAETADVRMAAAGVTKEGSAPADAPANYVGLRLPPLPEGLQSWGGTMAGEVDFAVDHVQDGEVSMLWLQRMLHRDENGISHWEVVAVQRFATPAKGEQVVLGRCEMEASPDDSRGFICAVARHEDTEWYTDIREAWRLDVENQRFVAVPPSNVRCINEGYGM